MRRCLRCGERFPDDHKFCPLDGTALDAVSPRGALVGALLDETYRVHELIGEGGMATIYVATNERIGKKFALKVLDPVWCKDEQAVARFFNEARAAAALNHPGVVEIFDCIRQRDGLAFMVMKLLVGEDIESIRHRSPGGRLPLEQVIWIAEQTADVLLAAHQSGIVHRDIKPSNLFLSRSFEGAEQIKVFDFGIARLLSRSRVTHGGIILGTPEYMSPEQAKGEADVDTRSDIYSLGATLYHCLCGVPPLLGESPIDTCVRVRYDHPLPARRHCVDIPDALDELIMSMLEKERSARPQSMVELIEAISEIRTSIIPTMLECRESPLASPANPEVRLVTALVADIEAPSGEGFQQQSTHRRQVYSILAQAVEAEGGVIGHLAGNRAVGLFGLELSLGDEPIRAVRAATRAQRRLGESFMLRVAIGTGRMLLPLENVATGPAAAAAARLLAHIEFGRVAVDAATYEGIRGLYSCALLPKIDGQPASYELVDYDERGGFRSTFSAFGRAGPVIGRDAESQELWEHFTDVVNESRVAAVTVTGQDGIGKTRLKTDFFDRLAGLESTQAIYLEGTGSALWRTLPYATLSDLLRRWARIELDVDAPTARERLKNALGAEVDEEFLELIAQAAMIEEPRRAHLRALSPKRLRERTKRAFSELISKLSREKPVVITIEEQHNADAASLEVIADLLNTVVGHPILVILIGQPLGWSVFGRNLTPEGGSSRIQLEPLSKSETRQMLSAALGDEPPPHLIDFVWERTSGVPLHIEELLFAFRHSGALEPQAKGSSWRLVPGTNLHKIPSSIEDLALAQLDAMPESMQEAVRRAAVFGEIFWSGALEALEIPDGADRIAELAGRELIVAHESSSIRDNCEYEFRSKVLQHVAYRTLARGDRAWLHSRVADWLERRGSSSSVVAFHLERAGRKLESAEMTLNAAKIAERCYATEDALLAYHDVQRLFADARSVGDDMIEWFNLCVAAYFGADRLLSQLERWEDALESLQALEDLAREQVEQEVIIRLNIRRGAAQRRTNTERAIKTLERVIEAARRRGSSELECLAALESARAHSQNKRIQQASSRSEQAVVAARKTGSANLVFSSLVLHGAINLGSGDHWTSLRALEEALEISQHRDDREREAELLVEIGFNRGELGQLNESRRALEDAISLCTREGYGRSRSAGLINYGWTSWRQARASEAIDALREAEEQAVRSGWLTLEIRAGIYRVIVEHLQGDRERALRRCQRLSRKATARSEHELAMHGAMIASIALLLDERYEESSQKALKAVSIFNTLSGTRQFAVEIHIIAVIALRAVGHGAEAKRLESHVQRALARRLDPIDREETKLTLRHAIGAGLPPIVAENFRIINP